MSTYIVSHTLTLVTDPCAVCGIVFAMPESFVAKRREDGDGFYCPNGHSLCYGNGENARLKKQLEQAKQRQELAEGREMHQRDQREAAERSNAALRGVITKTKKRAAAGVCQCCSRTFQDVARHMASQHPDFVASA